MAKQTAAEIREAKRRYIVQQARFSLARRDFWEFCKLMSPGFYKDSRPYLKRLCRTLQTFYETSEKEVLMINLPPRHGKTLTMRHFVAWVLGNHPEEKIMSASYNEDVSAKFSEEIRDLIQQLHIEGGSIVYNDIFPNTHVKMGKASKKMWSLEKQFSSYIATSPHGVSTGFPATILCVDDLISRAEIANNARELQKHFEWFTGTMMSRLEHSKNGRTGKIIIIMTRWSSGDLAGRLLEAYDPDKVQVVTERAVVNNETHEMLCPEIISWEEYQTKLRISPDKGVILANYQQEIIQKGNLLYPKPFATWTGDDLKDYPETYAYIDVADGGKDFTSLIIFSISRKKKTAIVRDVYYTQDAAEITEKEVAKRLHEFQTIQARCESNGGGSAFARNIKRILEQEHHDYVVRPTSFHQSKNKTARCLTWAAFVQDRILMPFGWESLYPDFYRDVMGASRDPQRDLHDDAVDSLTGVAETMELIGLA